MSAISGGRHSVLAVAPVKALKFFAVPKLLSPRSGDCSTLLSLYSVVTLWFQTPITLVLKKLLLNSWKFLIFNKLSVAAVALLSLLMFTLSKICSPLSLFSNLYVCTMSMSISRRFSEARDGSLSSTKRSSYVWLHSPVVTAFTARF